MASCGPRHCLDLALLLGVRFFLRFEVSGGVTEDRFGLMALLLGVT